LILLQPMQSLDCIGFYLIWRSGFICIAFAFRACV
jgi:hypothetical protein